MDAPLIEAACAVRLKAYAPYSRFRVGAAVRDETGRIHVGANVENASYPVGTCAEAGAIAAMIAAGGTRLSGIAVVGGKTDTEEGPYRLLTPCGACRQRLAEFSDGKAPVYLASPDALLLETTVAALLPLAFALEGDTSPERETKP